MSVADGQKGIKCLKLVLVKLKMLSPSIRAGIALPFQGHLDAGCHKAVSGVHWYLVLRPGILNLVQYAE